MSMYLVYNLDIKKEDVMKMQKRQFRIGELAQRLAVEKFVVRFWEKEFGLKTHRSRGGQRFYTEEDLETFQTIKDLLYTQGFTIAGAKQQLKIYKVKTLLSETRVVPSKKTTLHPEEINDKITHLQKQLVKLRELL